jgi:hypothetical protein
MRRLQLSTIAIGLLTLALAAPAAAAPTLGGCQVFPASTDANRGTLADLNRDISQAPLHPNSAGHIAAIDALSSNHFLHADFGSNPGYGIPFKVVPPSQPMVKVRFTAYGDESDRGPYPIPKTAPVEAGSDHHVLVLRQGECRLYELFDAKYVRSKKRWNAASGAIFNLNTGALRPEGWTSADAAGLPILPGLARYQEVHVDRTIEHALRFTVVRTQRAYIHPATHFASTCSPATCPNLPPMGLRLRLKAGFDTSRYHGDALVILTALKRYGMVVADNGGNWFITGATDTRWNDDDLNQLKAVPGTAFEVVDTGQLPRTG